MAEVFIERRSNVDRRHRTLSAYAHGALKPRRRHGRRATDRLYPVIDWHSPRVLALALLILLLSFADSALTVVLLEQGAVEINPFMALFVPHNLYGFVAVKLGLTGICLTVLVACSKMRLMRAIPGELFLYAILGCYLVLIGHELQMLNLIS
jgi:Domain of unknown function (DUF5658)